MRETLLEHIQSQGDVRKQTDSQVVCQSRYDLRVWQEYRAVRDLSGTSWLPAQKRIDGEVFDLIPPIGDYLYIVLDDGRRFNFFVRDTRGSVANTGGTFP